MNFIEIENLFDKSQWDVGYLLPEEMIEVFNHPIKIDNNDCSDSRDTPFFYLLLCKNTITYDYALGQEGINILATAGITAKKRWCNLKYAELLAGLGRQCKNSLIYNYRFGFDHHITLLELDIFPTDLPVRRTPNFELMEWCKDCNDCVNACPAHAIHAERAPYWIDYTACDDSCGYGNHPGIPSIKMNYYKAQGIFVPENTLRQITSTKIAYTQFGEGVGFTINKDGKEYYTAFPVCRECAAQTKCSKYNKHFPYQEQQTVIYEVEA